MKVKNISKNSLLKLRIITTKIYKKTYLFQNVKVEDIEYRLKKALQLFYKYHKNNKKILFLNSTSEMEVIIKQLLKSTIHSQISTQLFFNKLSKSKNDLTIIFDRKIDKNIWEEVNKSKIPAIFLGSSLDILNQKPNYKVPGNFVFSEKKIRYHFFLILLKNIFKKIK